MATPRRGREVDFAIRYSRQAESTLNAHNAIWRAQDLVADAIQLDAVPGMLKGSFRPAILSYYAVGYVTCLEWHARARTADFFSFCPKCITDRDFKDVGHDRLAEVASEGVKLSLLLAGMLGVGSLEEYLAPFNRIFDHFGFGCSAQSVLSRVEVRGITDVRPRLQALFEYRKHLVHEIDWRVIGPPTEDKWDFERVENTGHVVIASMWAIEEMIAAHAPNLFPHKLGNDAMPVAEDKALEGEVEALEDVIGQMVEGLDLEGEWKKLTQASRATRMYETGFVEVIGGPDRNKLLDESPRFRARLLAARLDYLRMLRAHLETTRL